MTSVDRAPQGRQRVTVSVVIVSWMVRDLLRACLETVRRQQRGGRYRYDVIVVDNASTDGSADMVRHEFPDVSLIVSTENLGFGKANNRALPACSGRYVLLLNPDTEVLDGAIDTMVAIMESEPRLGALGCRLLNSDGSYQRWTAGGFPNLTRTAVHAFMVDRVLSGAPSLFLTRDVLEDIDVDWVTGACLLLRRSALGDSIFDEHFFMYGEDTDLCARLRDNGWGVRYTPTATVIHHHGKSMAQQSGDMLLTSLKGPRAFYAKRHGAATVWLYDTLIATTFLLRWVLFTGAALVSRRPYYRDKAVSSRMYLTRALLVLRGH